jgi:hypothetical protein
MSNAISISILFLHSIIKTAEGSVLSALCFLSLFSIRSTVTSLPNLAVFLAFLLEAHRTLNSQSDHFATAAPNGGILLRCHDVAAVGNASARGTIRCGARQTRS